jgi:hypothetical protein
MRLTQEIIDGLDDGVRDLVVWLNEQGFETTDSGDGSKYGEMEGAMDCPMVAIVTTDDYLVHDADKLLALLENQGVDFPQDIVEGLPAIQATYNPIDQTGIILLTDILSKDLKSLHNKD